MASHLKGLILSALFLFLTGCGHLFYYPDRVLYFDPKKNNIEYTEIEFQSRDQTKLVGWYFQAQKKKAPSKNKVVVHFHGNAQNVSSHFSQLYWLTEHGYDYFILDYRGYGGSHGQPDHKGVQEDVVAAIEMIAQRTSSTMKGGESPQLILYAQSLGVATLLGAFDDLTPEQRQRIQAVVLEGGFSSYQRVARRVLSGFWMTWPFQWLPYLLLSDQHSGEKNIEIISPIPLLVIHGEDDKIVSFKESEIIFSKAREPKEFWPVPKADHLQTFYINQGEYQKRLLDYLERARTP